MKRMRQLSPLKADGGWMTPTTFPPNLMSTHGYGLLTDANPVSSGCLLKVNLATLIFLTACCCPSGAREDVMYLGRLNADSFHFFFRSLDILDEPGGQSR